LESEKWKIEIEKKEGERLGVGQQYQIFNFQFSLLLNPRLMKAPR